MKIYLIPLLLLSKSIYVMQSNNTQTTSSISYNSCIDLADWKVSPEERTAWEISAKKHAAINTLTRQTTSPISPMLSRTSHNSQISCNYIQHNVVPQRPPQQLFFCYTYVALYPTFPSLYYANTKQEETKPNQRNTW